MIFKLKCKHCPEIMIVERKPGARRYQTVCDACTARRVRDSNTKWKKNAKRLAKDGRDDRTYQDG